MFVNASVAMTLGLGLLLLATLARSYVPGSGRLPWLRQRQQGRGVGLLLPTAVSLEPPLKPPRMSPAASPANGIASANIIAGLLERAATLTTGLMKRNRSKRERRRQRDGAADAGGDADVLLFSPLNLKFRAKASSELVLKDDVTAREYLSLPASEYNLLDAAFVTRVQGSDEVFTLTLPLDSFASQIGIGAPVSLCTNLTVTPMPAAGRVIMSSGPILIRLSERKEGGSVDVAPVQDADGLVAAMKTGGAQESSTMSTLPVWLIYGASGTANGTITDATELQSSLQTGIQVELSWPTLSNKRAAEPSSGQGVDGTVEIVPVPLRVRARVHVDVSLSLPLPHDVSSVLGFLPIRSLLSQAGGLVAKTVLSTITPELSKALVADYEARMLRVPEPVSAMAKSRLVQEAVVVSAELAAPAAE